MAKNDQFSTSNHSGGLNNWLQYRFGDSTHLSNESDVTMEVFLGDDGKIKQPLECPSSYCLCTVDRWSMPDCVPGIKSRIDIADPGDGSKIITVLFANNQYIHLNRQGVKTSVFLIEPEDSYYRTVEAHFAQRGIDHIEEVNGSNRQATYTSNNYPPRRGSANTKISNFWRSTRKAEDAKDAVSYAVHTVNFWKSQSK